MAKVKFNVATFHEGVLSKLLLVSGEELTNYPYRIGRKVIITGDNILSNQTRGVISGFRYTAAGNALAQVKWLEGAPPVSVLVSRLQIDQPRKMYMLMQRNENGNPSFGTSREHFSAGRGYHNMRYSNLGDAQARASQIFRDYGQDVLIMETAGFMNVEGFSTFQ